MIQYFAYGSNINLEYLRSWLDGRGDAASELRTPQRAILHDYELRTNFYSCTHAAGACTIEPAIGEAVEGLLIQVDDHVRKALRAKEGWPHAYTEYEVQISIAKHERPLRAMTYIVVPELRLPCDLPVTPEYRQLILTAAKEHRFSQTYQRSLERILHPVAISRPIEVAS